MKQYKLSIIGIIVKTHRNMLTSREPYTIYIHGGPCSAKMNNKIKQVNL